jgi:Cu2+-containing amine oxidase
MSDTASELYGFQSTLRRHPLDPLSPQEVKIATTAVLEHVRRKGGDRNADEVRFIEVALKEADKIRVILAKHDPCEPFPQRHAMVIIWEKASKTSLGLVVQFADFTAEFGVAPLEFVACLPSFREILCILLRNPTDRVTVC